LASEGGRASRDGQEVDGEGFAPCSFALPDDQLVSLALEILDDGGYRVSWPPRMVSGQIAVFRMVTDDFEQLDSPDWGTLIYCGTG
jgi:hypothetical protein